MNKNTVYILQKDALTVVNYQSFVIPKGSEFHYMKDAGRYVCKENWCWYDEKFVENNPEWFKPKEHVNESKPTEQFQWDENLAREFGDLCNQEGWHHFSGKKNIDTLLEQFKQSKSKTAPKEEQVPIKVQMISFYTSMSEKLIRDVFSVRLTGDISEDKLQSIKEAIEGVLNGDNGNLVSLLRDCVSATWGCKDFKHTQDMFDKFLSDRKLLKKSI